MRETTGTFLRITNKTYKYFCASVVPILNPPLQAYRGFSPPRSWFCGFHSVQQWQQEQRNCSAVRCFQVCSLTCMTFVAAVNYASAFYEGATKVMTWVQKRPGHLSHITIIGSFWGTWKGARIPGPLKDECRRALGMVRICPRKLYEGNLERGLLYWWPRKIH